MKVIYYSFLCALVFYTQALCADVYKGTDSSGKTIYSDKPFENSEKIEVELPPTYTTPPVKTTIEPNKKETPVSYQLSIVAPTQDQTFTTDIKSIDVLVSVTPALQKGDKIQLLLNGQPHGAPSDATTFTLESLFRGAYTVQAQIISEAHPGAPLATSSSVTFYQRRTSIQ
jgi:hypothetical protein